MTRLKYFGALVPAVFSVLVFATFAVADNSVTPATLSFLATLGSTNPAAQTFTVAPLSATTSWTATATTSDGAPWLSISATSGTGTGSTVVSVNTALLLAGSYSGTVMIAFASDPRTYAQAIFLNLAPSTVTFAANLGGSNPPAQTLQLSIAGSGTIKGSFTASVSTSSGGSWLSVSPTFGNSGPLTVSAAITGLAVGTYNGTIMLTGGGFTGGNNTDTYMPVLLTISTLAVTVTPATLAFSGTTGVAPLPTQAKTVQVTASSGWSGSVAVTGSSVNWLSISPTSGTGNGPFSVTADASKLTASTTAYAGTITITPTGTGQPVTVAVSFLVFAPTFTLAPSNLTFNATYGAASAPPAQIVNVTAASGWSGSVSTTGGGNWLSIVPVSATSSGTFSVTINSSILAGGQTYTGSVAVTPAGSGTPGFVQVTVNVAGHTISVTPQTLSFTQVEGQVASAKIVMLGAVPAASNWSTSASVTNSTLNWLSVSPGSGGFPPAASGTASIYPNSDAVALTAAGSPYQGTITFTDSNASPTTLTVQVTLNVTPVAATPQLTVGQTSVAAQGTTVKAGTQAEFLIGNAAGGTLNWSAKTSGDTIAGVGQWFTVFPASGSATLHTPSIFIVTFAENLPANVYSGSITVTAGTQSQVIPVLYTVTTNALPLMRLSNNSWQFEMIAGGPLPTPQPGHVVNRGPTPGLFSFDQADAFVSVPPLTGALSNAEGDFEIGILPTSFDQTRPGVHYGRARVVYFAQSDPKVVIGTDVITVVLVVLQTTTPPTATAYPVGVILTPSQLSQTVAVSTDATTPVPLSLSLPITPLPGTFLSASASSGSLNPAATITITAGGSLPTKPGTYRSLVTAILGNGLPSVDITVTLIIPQLGGADPQSRHAAAVAACTPTRAVLAMRQLAGNFSSTVGWPQNIEAQLVDDCANPVNGATVLASFSTGDAALALSSVGGGIYSATWNPGNANPATVTITAISSPLPIVSAAVPGTVAANATPPPQVSTAGVVNGASFGQNGLVSPGEIISIFGSTLATAPTPNSGFPLPTTLAGIKLSIGDVDLPLFFAGTGQVNAQVPTTLTANSTVSLLARAFNGTTETADSVPVTLTVAANTPGIFIAAESGAPNQGAILNNPALQVVDAAHPATVGDVITIYCTGLGATSPTPATGGASTAAQTTNPVTVTFGISAPVAVQYAGLTPGFVGLYQVNVAVPAGLTPGSAVPVVLNQNGVSSNVVTIAVH